MTPERWRQVTELFHSARARNTDDRRAFLDEVCAGDPSLRADVDALLAADGTRFGETPLVVEILPQLSTGTTFGPYRVEGLIGAGGMGQVYRATDTRLRRTVALKVLLPDLARDPDFGSRFEREAQLLAALNHPNIAAIHGIEDVAGVQALVLEFVDGPTLAERIARGPMPIGEVLAVAQQVASALEAAHERGIVHRDLKPANIKVTPNGAAKVLDFGIARVAGGSSTAPTAAATGTGKIIGTAAYMSPEQARGLAVDKRTDIWACGCVLYEMLTGRAAFNGETVSDTIAHIIEREPDWQALPADVPPAIRRLLQRSLKKDPAERLHDIADARLEIVDATSAPSTNGRATISANQRWRPSLILAAIAALIVGMVSFALLYRDRALQRSAPLEFPINLPPTAGNAGYGLAVSPDGHRVAYAACCGGPQIWVHSLDSSETRPVLGTERAARPFWSPDSSEIGFFANDKLMRVDLAGGPVTLIADVPGPGGFADWGGSWNTDGVILFSAHGKLFRVSVTGGAPTEVEERDAVDGLRGQPQFLTDNRHFIYYLVGRRARGVYLASLDSTQATHLLDTDSGATYAAPSYLIFLRGTTLMAQRLNLETSSLEGPAAQVASDAAPSYISSGRGLFASASANGVLAFAGASLGHLTWFDRTGKALGSVDQPDGIEYLNPALSPDGGQIAVNRMDPQTGNWDIWTVDAVRGGASRVTSDPARDADPVWSPDGKEIAFDSNRQGRFGIYKTAVANSGAEERLVLLDEGVQDVTLTDWSPGYVLYTEVTDTHPWQTQWALPLSGDRKPFQVLQSETRESRKYAGRRSPDGKWLAYESWETGVSEIYIERFMAHADKQQISHAGGAHPRWTRNGRELVYWLGPTSGGLMSVDIDFTASGIRAGVPKPLISTPIPTLIDGRPHYDVTRDGERFLLRQPAGPNQPTITVIVNWWERLKRPSS